VNPERPFPDCSRRRYPVWSCALVASLYFPVLVTPAVPHICLKAGTNALKRARLDRRAGGG